MDRVCFQHALITHDNVLWYLVSLVFMMLPLDTGSEEANRTAISPRTTTEARRLFS